MSRIGKKPIPVPRGVEVTITEENRVTVKGPKGTLSQQFSPEMLITHENGVITVARPSDDKRHRALHGLTRSLIANMVTGVTEGYQRILEITGIGYRAAREGKKPGPSGRIFPSDPCNATRRDYLRGAGAPQRK
jgi:large subunit ribosomal protein L6